MKKLYIKAEFKHEEMLRFSIIEMEEEDYNMLPKAPKAKYRTIIIPLTINNTFEPTIEFFDDEY